MIKYIFRSQKPPTAYFFQVHSRINLSQLSLLIFLFQLILFVRWKLVHSVILCQYVIQFEYVQMTAEQIWQFSSRRLINWKMIQFNLHDAINILHTWNERFVIAIKCFFFIREYNKFEYMVYTGIFLPIRFDTYSITIDTDRCWTICKKNRVTFINTRIFIETVFQLAKKQIQWFSARTMILLDIIFFKYFHQS